MSLTLDYGNELISDVIIMNPSPKKKRSSNHDSSINLKNVSDVVIVAIKEYIKLNASDIVEMVCIVVFRMPTKYFYLFSVNNQPISYIALLDLLEFTFKQLTYLLIL